MPHDTNSPGLRPGASKNRQVKTPDALEPVATGRSRRLPWDLLGSRAGYALAVLATGGSALRLVNIVFGRFGVHDYGSMTRQAIWVVASIRASLLAGVLLKARYPIPSEERQP